MREEDLYQSVKELLIKNNYVVQSEINDCDVAAIKDSELLIVELKKNLTVELLVQAVKRQKMTDIVYIAIPKSKNRLKNKKWNDICHLIKRLELGLILVTFIGSDSYAQVVIEPNPYHKIRSKKKRKNILTEFSGRTTDLNTGGSKGKKIMTAYKEKALYIAVCLSMYGVLSPKQLRNLGTDSKKTTTILSKNFYNWFKRVDHGKYDLTDEGIKAIKIYQVITDLFKKRLTIKNKDDRSSYDKDSNIE